MDYQSLSVPRHGWEKKKLDIHLFQNHKAHKVKNKQQRMDKHLKSTYKVSFLNISESLEKKNKINVISFHYFLQQFVFQTLGFLEFYDAFKNAV